MTFSRAMPRWNLAGSSERPVSAWFAFWLGALSLGLQIFLPTVVPALGLVNLPFLAVLLLVLEYRAAIPAMVAGMLVGWAQDGLTYGPVGVYGLAYTVVGYLVASASQVFRVGLPLVTGLVVALAYLLHEVVLFLVRDYLLGQSPAAEIALWAALAALHAGLAVLVTVFRPFDRWLRAR